MRVNAQRMAQLIDDLLALSRVTRSGLRQAMAATLDQEKWDVVISDYAMPHFSGLAALEALRVKSCCE